MVSHDEGELITEENKKISTSEKRAASKCT